MARTLSAGARAEPRQQSRAYVDCADVVAGLWITLGKLWMPGRRYGKVLGLMADTRTKLNEPALRDHPKRPDAEARMEGWRLELRDLEVKAEPYRRGVARQWDGIPERVHRFLRDSGGWPEGSDGKAVAQGLWRLLRNLAGADADDWVCWHVSVPDTGQGGEAALAELVAAAQEARL